jgi:hypothetical protein
MKIYVPRRDGKWIFSNFIILEANIFTSIGECINTFVVHSHNGKLLISENIDLWAQTKHRLIVKWKKNSLKRLSSTLFNLWDFFGKSKTVEILIERWLPGEQKEGKTGK